MTAYKHLRRRPTTPNLRFGFAGAPSRFASDVGPTFAGGPFRQTIRITTDLGAKPPKPHSR